MKYIKKIQAITKKILAAFRFQENKKQAAATIGRRKVALPSQKNKAQALPQAAVTSTKFDTEPRTLPASEVSREENIPLGYGDDVIVLQARDPWWLHSYWDVKEGTIQRLRRELVGDFDSAKWTLRVYDVSYINFNGGNANSFFDIEVNSYARNWYISVFSGRSYVVDLGLKLPDGRFITIVRSNCVTMPLDGPSCIIDEAWMIPDEEFDRLYNVGFGGSSPLGMRKRGKAGEYISSPDYVSSFIGKSKSP